MAALLLLALLFPEAGWAADSTSAVNEKMAGLTRGQDFPERKLRGYGKMAGRSWTDGVGGSLLEIDCQDADHARLVQAKYLSDLDELPPATRPIRIDIGGTTISAREAESRGAVAALRDGAVVVIAAAPGSGALAKLLGTGLAGSRTGWTSEADRTVPMYLNRFDKYGFRFYYAPGRMKPGPDGREMPDYDPSADFDFAESSNHSGITMWHSGRRSETAEWMTAEPVWEWALRDAEKRGMPVGINMGIDSNVYWLYNRRPETLMQFAPDFLGSYYGSMNFGIGPMVSWSSAEGQDLLLAQLQGTVRRFKDTDNITSWLEPHEELGHGPAADILANTGPQADADYQGYLRAKYKTLAALSQHWYGDAASLSSWDQVKAPEPADFLGWGPDALDLAGTWRVSFDAADDPTATTSEFDDGTWPTMTAPGHALARLLPQKPALWRRHFPVDAGWLGRHRKVWLYVWDMNDTRGVAKDPAKKVVVTLNGKALPEAPLISSVSHWCSLEVTSLLRPDGNVLAVRLPQGLFNYRVYLSGEEPKSYPNLGTEKNARWADFFDWNRATRVAAARRGMQSIRQIDPDRGIVLMSPDSFVDGMQQAAIEYGGDFHNTGYMGGWWCDRLPALMRSAGLPMSTEPGNGPTLPVHMLSAFGYWATEGVNAIDYFQNLGEILWTPALKQCFQDHVAQWTTIGRYHAPEAQVAALYSFRVPAMAGYPWEGHPTGGGKEPYYRGCGYPSVFNCRAFFSPMENNPAGPEYESDAVTETQFARDQVGRYRVIVDSGTSILDNDAIDGIERYVRNGGIFVTYGDTGRHSSDQPDSWPISRLTGFLPTRSPQVHSGQLRLAGGQAFLPSDWASGTKLTGLQLTRTEQAPEAEEVAKWDDGTTAIGLRPLGKGYVVTLGPWFDWKTGNAFFSSLFAWLKIDPIPAHYETPAPQAVLWRHFVGNNGLSDVWVIWNKQKDQEADGTLVLDSGLRPTWRIDIRSGERTPVVDGRLPFHLPALETVVYVTPRPGIAEAPANWFGLQREWWKGTADPGAPFPKPEMKLAVDLTDDWLFQPIDLQQANVSSLIDPKANDKGWIPTQLGIITLPDHPEVRRAVLRKHFRVPDAWNDGRVVLRLPEFRYRATVFLDGTPLAPDAPIDLPAGSEHVVAVDVQGKGPYLGARNGAWIAYHPKPAAQQDIGGDWEPSPDYLSWKSPAKLPDALPPGMRALRRIVKIDAAAAGKTVVLHVMQQGRLINGVVINGTYARPWTAEASELNLNVTPWVKPGQDNEIILLDTGGKDGLRDLALEFHTPGTYP